MPGVTDNDSVERMECLHHCICCQKVKDLEIVMDDTRLRTYPGMAKDIGNLTLRVDNLEKGVEISHDRCLRLETAFKSLKEEVNGMSITAENGTIYSLKVKREL